MKILLLIKKNFNLKKSSIDDDHIQDAINLYAKTKGIDVKSAEIQFQLRLNDRIAKNKGIRMNKNMDANMAEAVAFEFIGKLDPKEIDLSAYGIEDHEDLLDRDYFFDLTQYVLGENAQFFPLRNPFERQAVRPYFFITPDHLPLMKDSSLRNAAKTQCDTAFCTTKAEMVFNREFTEKLAISALVNKIKPKSKKYKSNGGPIPDHYAYLEFVIMHELLHFSAGDHFYTKSMIQKMKKKYPKIGPRQAHDVLNYVGDYINNWQLAKSGYEQLPIGLFSEDINYDKIGSYEEIIDAVVEDISALTSQDYEDMADEIKDDMDEHLEDENDNTNTNPNPNPPEPKEVNGRKIYKVGDKIKNKKTGKVGVVTSASKPDENGLQELEIFETEGVNDVVKYITEIELNEAGTVSVTNDDVEIYKGNSEPNPNPDKPEPNPDEESDEPGDPGEPRDEDGDGDEISQEEWDNLPPEVQDEMKRNGFNEPDGDEMADAIDNAMKDNQEKVDKRDDGNNDADTALETKDTDGTDNEIKKKAGEASAKIEMNKTTPVVNWKKILKRMIPDDVGDPEDTYAKMSRQATSTMVTAQQTGVGRITPGEIMVDSDRKGLVFVIDNSGSVSRKVNEFNQEILQLLKKNKKLLSKHVCYQI